MRLAKQVADAIGRTAIKARQDLDADAAAADTTWLGQERVCVHKYLAFSYPFKAMAYVMNRNGDEGVRAWKDLLDIAESHNWQGGGGSSPASPQ